MAMMSDPTPIILGAFGLAATAIGALAWGFKYVLKEIRPALDRVNEMGEKNNKAIDRNTKTQKAADTYLRQRNGRDADVHVEVMRTLKSIPAEISKVVNDSAKANLKEYRKLSATKVAQQHVEHQIVEEKVVKEK